MSLKTLHQKINKHELSVQGGWAIAFMVILTGQFIYFISYTIETTILLVQNEPINVPLYVLHLIGVIMLVNIILNTKKSKKEF